MKPYQSVKETERKFLVVVNELKERGDFTLPSERDLCKHLDCSRVTLRRMLEIQEEKGAIIKKGKVRTLSKALVSPPPIGEFAFLAVGQGMVANPAWNKLWTALQRKAEEEQLSVKLVLIPWNKNEKESILLLENLPDIVVTATIDNRFVREKLFENLQNKILITTEEHYTGQIKNVICLDNYHAGFLCAKKLAEHGYKKPAFICHKLITSEHDLYLPFKRRIEGFREGCKKYGLYWNKASEFWISGKNYRLVVGIIKAAEKIVSLGYDSVFLHTDDHVDFFYEALLEEGCKIPENFGLVTLNSFDKAVNHTPRISAASHGTQEVAGAIINKINKIIKTGKQNFGKILVRAGFHKGETLK